MINEVIPKAQHTPIDEARLSIDGFTLFLNFDPTLQNLGYRGIAMYVSNQIRATNLSLGSPFHEHLWLSIPLRGNDSLWIGYIYRSPSSNLETSTEYLCDLLTKLCSHLLICGDFNYVC